MSAAIDKTKQLLSRIERYFAEKRKFPKKECKNNSDCAFFKNLDMQLSDVARNIKSLTRNNSIKRFAIRYDVDQTKLSKKCGGCMSCGDSITFSAKNAIRSKVEKLLVDFKREATIYLKNIGVEQATTDCSIEPKNKIVRKNPMH